MNWEAIGAIAELAGALGVIVSLLYLAAQIRTGNASSKAQMEQTRLTNFTDLMLSTLPHTELMIDGLAPGIATELEAKRDVYFHAWLNSTQYTHNLVELGHLERDNLERMYGRHISYWLRHYQPFRAWWEFSNPNFSPGVSSWVEEHDSGDAQQIVRGGRTGEEAGNDPR